MAGKRIFMTGASGYIGSQITRLAIADGYTVHGLVRSDEKAAHLASLGGVGVLGDLNDANVVEVLRRECAEADFVIHLASTVNMGDMHDGANFEAAHKADVRAIDAMLDGLASTGNVAGKALVTTGGALFAEPDPAGGETDETAPERSELPVRGFRGIEHAFKAGRALGIRVVSIRVAPWVYGRADSGVALFMRMFYMQAGAFFYVDDGAWRTTTIHVDDIASLYLRAAEKGRDGEEYNGTDQTDVTFRQLAEAIASTLGVPALSLPAAEAKAKFGYMFSWFLSAENRASNAKAKKELDWEPTVKVGILEDITKGSYVALAEELKKQKAAGAKSA